MGAFCSHATDEPANPPPAARDPPPPLISPDPSLPQPSPFRLLDLPTEVILTIITAVDERDPSPTFPAGPPTDLLNLSLTSRWFHSLCHPLVWRSIRYTPEDEYRPAEWREKRDLQALRSLILEREKAQRAPFPVLQLSLTEPSLFDTLGSAEGQAEEDAYIEVIEAFARTTLQVLFLKEVEMSAANGAKLLAAVETSPRLSALRFNQVDFAPDPPGRVQSMGSLPRIKTLQVMHSDPELFDLILHSPNLDSVLLWPSSRRLSKYMPHIVSLLPHLRNLSLDAVKQASVFRTLANEILRLSPTLDLPLTELFLEGPSTATDLAVLVQALAQLPNLRRLALYQVQEPKPALFHDLAAAMPRLEALTVVSGDCSEAVEWPAPLEAYLPQLRKLPYLRFFAWDRRSPRVGPTEAQLTALAGEGGIYIHPTQKRAEFDALAQVGQTCKRLREAVAITSDVSEGSSGYFATYTRERGSTRIALVKKTVNEFLIGYDRWVQVEDD
ncbi:hypothetical protein JCM10207_008052 [Rhodosporidiobolus poonsookiae]